jgi:hypothetical protein
VEEDARCACGESVDVQDRHRMKIGCAREDKASRVTLGRVDDDRPAGADGHLVPAAVDALAVAFAGDTPGRRIERCSGDLERHRTRLRTAFQRHASRAEHTAGVEREKHMEVGGRRRRARNARERGLRSRRIEPGCAVDDRAAATDGDAETVDGAEVRLRVRDERSPATPSTFDDRPSVTRSEDAIAGGLGAVDSSGEAVEIVTGAARLGLPATVGRSPQDRPAVAGGIDRRVGVPVQSAPHQQERAQRPSRARVLTPPGPARGAPKNDAILAGSEHALFIHHDRMQCMGHPALFGVDDVAVRLSALRHDLERCVRRSGPGEQRERGLAGGVAFRHVTSSPLAGGQDDETCRNEGPELHGEASRAIT